MKHQNGTMRHDVANHFIHRSAARRYASARPCFHPLVMKRIAAFTAVSRFARGLDVACGTGQSARALASIADSVDAVDVSQEMLAEAEPHDCVSYQVAAAERLPFENDRFDLATVGLAFHWFDQASFLAEARRVLKPQSWLVVYTSGFNGEMAEKADFRQWAWEDYPKRFPTPPRRTAGVIAELVQPHGFTLAGQDGFSHDETMTAEQLTGYLLTQTNVIAAVESGSRPLVDAAEWILTAALPFFKGSTATMKFGGNIWYLKRGE